MRDGASFSRLPLKSWRSKLQTLLRCNNILFSMVHQASPPPVLNVYNTNKPEKNANSNLFSKYKIHQTRSIDTLVWNFGYFTCFFSTCFSPLNKYIQILIFGIFKHITKPCYFTIKGKRICFSNELPPPSEVFYC